MRVVLDTNVLVSGVYFGGVPGRILSAWAEGRIICVLSPEIMEEYRRVGESLGELHPHLAEVLEPVLALLAMKALIVAAPRLSEQVCQDPADDKFLAAAIASRTRHIVSGDKHLLAVSGWRGVAVLTPRQFVGMHL